MKIIILKGSLKEVHIEKINRIAADIGAEVCYIKNENGTNSLKNESRVLELGAAFDEIPGFALICN